MADWTSIEAYKKILPYLKPMQDSVLRALVKWPAKLGPPTAKELAKKMGLERDSVQPRLNELRLGRNAVHKGGTRPCNFTGHTARIWLLGPNPGTELIESSEVQETPLVSHTYDAQVYVLDINYAWAECSLRMVSTETEPEDLQDEVVDAYQRAHPEAHGKVHQVWLFSYEEVEA